MKEKRQRVLCIYTSDLIKYILDKNTHLTKFDCYVHIPTKDDKKFILDYVSDPNFSDYYYLLFDSFINFKGKFCEMEMPFIKIPINNCQIITVDSNMRMIIGTKKKPYKIYEPPSWLRDTGKYYLPDGKIIPYVCYHHNGEIIPESIEKIIENLPEDCSEDSVILVFQWKYENPSREGYYIIPRIITVTKLSEHLK